MGGAVFPPWNFSVSVQLLSCVWLLVTPWIAAHQASMSITNSQNPPKPMSIYLGPNYDEGNEDNGDLLQKIPCIAMLH